MRSDRNVGSAANDARARGLGSTVRYRSDACKL